jgi:hypothetical protein
MPTGHPEDLGGPCPPGTRTVRAGANRRLTARLIVRIGAEQSYLGHTLAHGLITDR